MTTSPEVEVARLDGFLGGIAAASGEIRSFSAHAFFVPSESGHRTPSEAIQHFYASQTVATLTQAVALVGGLGELERRLPAYVTRGSKVGPLPESALSAVEDRGRFLAFRVLDAIADIIGRGADPVVSVVDGRAPNSSSAATFFCIQFLAGTLFLQFNDDSTTKTSVTRDQSC